MEFPSHLHPHLGQIIGIETEAAVLREKAEKRRSSWAVIYNLIPFKDGDQWCVLLGKDVQAGIAGFGDTPEEAISEFDIAMKMK